MNIYRQTDTQTHTWTYIDRHTHTDTLMDIYRQTQTHTDRDTAQMEYAYLGRVQPVHSLRLNSPGLQIKPELSAREPAHLPPDHSLTVGVTNMGVTIQVSKYDGGGDTQNIVLMV